VYSTVGVRHQSTGSRDLLNFGPPNYILGIDISRNFKLLVLIDAEEY